MEKEGRVVRNLNGALHYLDEWVRKVNDSGIKSIRIAEYIFRAKVIKVSFAPLEELYEEAVAKIQLQVEELMENAYFREEVEKVKQYYLR